MRNAVDRICRPSRGFSLADAIPTAWLWATVWRCSAAKLILAQAGDIGADKLVMRLRDCLKNRRRPVFAPQPVWLGATREHTPSGSVTGEQQRQTGLGAKTLRAAALLPVGFVGSFLTAPYGDARNSPPRPQPKSLAAGHLRFFRQSLRAKPCVCSYLQAKKLDAHVVSCIF